MSKRSNPYAEDYIPQSKTYVSLKQFNNNEHRLQKVYEKTLDMLFKGANKPIEEESIKTNGIKQQKKDGKKQLFIGRDGSLLHTGFQVSEKSAVEECECGNIKAEHCAYCESVLCTSCQHHCQRCSQYYCSRCSLSGLDSSEVCVSCYT
ncbi:apoptosis regulatory protein Siva-like [Aricia agestis]|uniref:apoptosis regulatory protein Siva-like n=1 Tax=Aricia agestis TaxID=91739 RepID=UPI001C20B315|nr:apoptosis regulatory protein Siva-like [Aricia agestis]